MNCQRPGTTPTQTETDTHYRTTPRDRQTVRHNTTLLVCDFSYNYFHRSPDKHIQCQRGSVQANNADACDKDIKTSTLGPVNRDLERSAETWTGQQRLGLVNRDLERSAETWTGQQRLGLVNRDLERSAETWTGQQTLAETRTSQRTNLADGLMKLVEIRGHVSPLTQLHTNDKSKSKPC